MPDLINVRFVQISSLIEVLLTYKSRDVSYIKSLFSRFSEGFDETISLLEDLNLLYVKNSQIFCQNDFQILLDRLSNEHQREEFLKEFLLSIFLDNTRIGALPFVNYLDKFKLIGEALIYAPNIKENIKSSGVRNLLMEVGLVSHSSPQRYQINKSSINSIDHKKLKISKETFDRLEKAKAKIGLQAELWVLDNERKRLSNFPGLQSKILHISEETVNAGYDILSYEDNFNDACNPACRYIEVKAVQINYRHFYLSKNEILKAEELGKFYWLYLVFYDDSTNFNVINVEEISDPYEMVIKNNDSWKKQIESYSFTKI